MLLVEIEQKTNIRFKNVADYETYVNAIDVMILKMFFSQAGLINTPQFNIVKRSGYGKVTDFKQGIVEFVGNNSYIPPSGYCIGNVLII